MTRGDLDVLLGPLPIAGDDLEIEPLFREPQYLVDAMDSHLAIGKAINHCILVSAKRPFWFRTSQAMF